MSFTAILKKLERINQQQQRVEERYNRQSHSCPRRTDLRQEEVEDKKIFGYSQAQILNNLQQKQSKQMQLTRPCTALQTRPQSSSPNFTQTLEQKFNRPHTAGYMAVPYRQQFNFFFKEDIFNENHDKMQKTAQIQNQSCDQKQRMQRIFTNKNAPKSLSKTLSKSLRVQKKIFAQTFSSNMQKIRIKQQKTLGKISINKMIYNRKSTQQLKRKSNIPSSTGQDLFHLTNAVVDQHFKSSSLSLSIQNLKDIRLLLNKGEDIKFSEDERRAEYGRSLALSQMEIKNYFPSKFTITCISITTLHSLKLRLKMANHFLKVEGTKQVFCLKSLLSQLLAKHTGLHICFHANGNLLYEEYVFNKPLSLFKSKQNQIAMVTYYLKRFLLFDGVTSLKSVHQTSELILKSNIEIPVQFTEFIESLNGKECHLFDRDCRLYHCSLKEILSSGLSSIEAFKKEMGFGQRVVKLKKGTREQLKKYMYNWQYFFICLFLLAINTILLFYLLLILFFHQQIQITC